MSINELVNKLAIKKSEMEDCKLINTTSRRHHNQIWVSCLGRQRRRYGQRRAGKVKPKQDDENWWYIEACDEEGTRYGAQFSLRQETYGLEAFTCDGVFAGDPGTWEVFVSYLHTRLWL